MIPSHLLDRSEGGCRTRRRRPCGVDVLKKIICKGQFLAEDLPEDDKDDSRRKRQKRRWHCSHRPSILVVY
ncbi:hypothetical protein QVD17_41203 [Tagetes erecta]|uniref:Uncharacterized protein n=1 Tax=Tagetes erecta TaxID=13708 RepID=A0AAD8JUL5_TARER|nr:hypothetical protein QVD17_41203 [Tagetes erecta]